mgnify:CR=1 FL=1
MIEIGNKAPEFTLMGDDGKEYSLSSFRGQKVLLYFYPKDNTPGCTKEACSLRDWKDEITKRGTVIILLSDPEKTVHEAYGTWGEKKLYGKVSLGVLRKTFLIDEEGNIEKIWNKVAVLTHGEDVVKYLDEKKA